MMIDPSVSQLLDPGERLIWSGKPNAFRYATNKSTVIFLFGLFFFGFSVFWMYGATNQSGGSFALFGTPFVLAGAGMVLSPIWHIWRGSKATYVLTSKRVLTVFTGLFARRISVPLRQIRFIDVRPNNDGDGDIYFKETAASDGEGTTIRREGFIAIPEVDQVERLLRETIERSSAAEPRGVAP
jgi:hypothetical protein